MRVYCCQIDCVWEDKQKTNAVVQGLAERVNPEPSSLFILPETYATGFTMDTECSAEATDGETLQFISGLARRFGIWVTAGIVVKDASGVCRNQSVTVGPDGSEVGRYSKIFPFTRGKENTVHAAGSRVVSFPVGEFTMAPFVCFDLRFPEIFRAAALQGTNLITVIASWPMPRTEHWMALLRARAIENQSYVVGVNRCGTDPFFTYEGRSMVIDPSGKVLADAGNAEGVVSAELDLTFLKSYRADLPFLADLRPEYLNPPI
jgi:omega-amidase